MKKMLKKFELKAIGFTLVELLAVITILSIIALVVSISVANMLKESKNSLTSVQLASIKESAESWGADNIENLPINNDCSYITLKNLIDDGYLESEIINPDDKKPISNFMLIKIESKLNNQGKTILTYIVNPKTVEECNYIGDSIYVPVPGGMTPVLYDEKLKSWRVPNINEEWYNYDKQMWANAVVLGKGKTKKPGEVVKVDGTDALMMLVYIPRYEYKIEGDFGKGGTQELPGEIEVKFVNNNQTKADDIYIMHPAFTFENKELSGIWVGKFELSHIEYSNLEEKNSLNCENNICNSAKGLRILPNTVTLRNNNVSNLFYYIRSIENTEIFGLKNIDTHMIKNNEWGAVAYLSQSKYGKYGNDDYDGVYKEIYQNKSTEHITGSSNKASLSTIEDIQCVYNDMTNLGPNKGQCGPGASTTGTIYGIYDMSGGSDEYTMGMYEKNNNIYTGNSEIYNSGFSGLIYKDSTTSNYFSGVDLPESKYYNTYNADSCKIYKCVGEAFYEVFNWYNNNNNMALINWPWIARGGSYGDNKPNIFFFWPADGGNRSNKNSTRAIFIEK